MLNNYIDTLSIPLAMQPIMVVWLALLLEKLISVPPSTDPISFFAFVCKRMARKVIGQQYDEQQLLVSGTLALTMLLAPTLVIVYLLHSFASYQWLFDTLLMFLLIQYSQDTKLIGKAIDALSTNKKQLAKDLLQQKMLRNTQTLSALGLTKAAVESLYLRYHHQLFTTILCYLLLGPIAALCYRLCLETHRVWNVKLPTYAVFGRFTNKITLIFQLIPSILLSVSFVIISSPHATLNFFKHKQLWPMLRKTMFLQNNQDILLLSIAHAVNINVGGPIMYSDKKQQRMRISNTYSNDCVEPTAQSVNVLISLLNRHLLVTLLLVTCFSLWLS